MCAELAAAFVRSPKGKYAAAHCEKGKKNTVFSSAAVLEGERWLRASTSGPYRPLSWGTFSLHTSANRCKNSFPPFLLPKHSDHTLNHQLETKRRSRRCSVVVLTVTEGDHKTIKIRVWGNHSAIQLVSVKAPAIEIAAPVQSPIMISSGCVHSGHFLQQANMLSLRSGCCARLPYSADEIDTTMAIKTLSYLAASFLQSSPLLAGSLNAAVS